LEYLTREKTLVVDLGGTYEQVQNYDALFFEEESRMDKELLEFSLGLDSNLSISMPLEVLQNALTEFCFSRFKFWQREFQGLKETTGSNRLFVVDIPTSVSLAAMNVYSESRICLLPHSHTSGAYQLPLKTVDKVFTLSDPSETVPPYPKSVLSKFMILRDPKREDQNIRLSVLDRLRTVFSESDAIDVLLALRPRLFGGRGLQLSDAIKALLSRGKKWIEAAFREKSYTNNKPIIIGVLLEWQGYGLITNFSIKEALSKLNQFSLTWSQQTPVIFYVRPKPNYLSPLIYTVSSLWPPSKNIRLSSGDMSRYVNRCDSFLSWSQHAGVSMVRNLGGDVALLTGDLGLVHSYQSDMMPPVDMRRLSTIHELQDFIDEINKVNNTQFLDEKGSLMGYLQNLRKLATGRDLDNNIVIENPKIQILKELLEDIPDNQKVIIWHNLYIELEDILKAIKDNFVLLNGEQNNKEKAEAIYNFKHGDKKYLIATQSTGGVGLNFTEATINIYFSNSFNLIDRLQSESRSHRIGQKEQLIIYDIVNLGSIDTKILKSLERKEDFLQQLQDLYKQKKEEVIKILEDK
jgi:hypothetical protein